MLNISWFQRYNCVLVRLIKIVPPIGISFITRLIEWNRLFLLQMSTTDKKPALVPAMFSMKCPSCRKGFVFENKSIFPLGKTVALKNTCDVCGQKLVSEKNNGAGMNYALTMVVFLLNICWFIPLYGLIDTNKNGHWYDTNDNSIWWYLISSTLVVILLQPWLMRMSRMIYLYLYVSFGDSGGNASE